MLIKFLLRAVALSTALVAGQAGAASLVFGSVGSSGTLLFQTTQDGATLSSKATFTLSTLTSSSATFAVSVANNSSGPGKNALVSFGIDVVSPSLTGVTDTSAVWDTALNTTLPSFQKVDLCVFASNGCQGGGINDGLAEGGSSTFNLTLTTAGSFSSGITFTSPYGAKFQDVGNGGKSWEFAGCIQGSTGCGGGGGGGSNQVPEPGSLALVGLALLGLGAVRRRIAR